MASLTEAEAIAMLKSIVTLRAKAYDVIEVTATTVVASILAALEIGRGDRIAEFLQGVEVIRSAWATLAGPDVYRPACNAVILSWAESLSIPTDDVALAFREIYRLYILGPKDVNSRGITRGAFTFSGATGNGAVRRVTVDAEAMPIETMLGAAEAWALICTR